MLNKIKRNIIAILTAFSWAIFTCPALAIEAPLANQPTTMTASQPIANPIPKPPEKDPKQYLLEDIPPSWFKDSLDSLQAFQVWLGGYVQNTGDGIDNYFGTAESFEETKGNRLDIMLPVIFHNSGEVEMQVRLRAKLALPKLRKNWHLLFTSQDSSQKNSSTNELANEMFQEQDEATLGLQALLDATKESEVYLDVGAKFTNVTNLDPYIRIKKRFNWDLSHGWNTRMSQSLFWERVAGPGIDSKLVFDKPIDKHHLFRAQTDGTWWHDEAYYELKQRLLLYKIINSYRVFTYQTWIAFDTQNQGFEETDYGLAFNWRERAYKNWLYFEVQPGILWSDENDFSTPDVTLMLMLEMRFFKHL